MGCGLGPCEYTGVKGLDATFLSSPDLLSLSPRFVSLFDSSWIKKEIIHSLSTSSDKNFAPLPRVRLPQLCPRPLPASLLCHSPYSGPSFTLSLFDPERRVRFCVVYIVVMPFLWSRFVAIPRISKYSYIDYRPIKDFTFS